MTEVYRGLAKDGTSHFHAYDDRLRRPGEGSGSPAPAASGGRQGGDLPQGSAGPTPPEAGLFGRGSGPGSAPGPRLLRRRRDPLPAGGAVSVPDAGGDPRPRRPTTRRARGDVRVFAAAGTRSRLDSNAITVTGVERSGRPGCRSVCVLVAAITAGSGSGTGAGRWSMPAGCGGPLRAHVVRRETYRSRFGIESSYRQMNQARGRTSTRRPDLRLLYVGLSLVLRNEWVWFHFDRPHCRRRGGAGGLIRLERLRLRRCWALADPGDRGKRNTGRSTRRRRKGLLVFKTSELEARIRSFWELLRLS